MILHPISKIQVYRILVPSTLFSVLLLLIFTSGCKPAEPVFCTQEFRSIQVSVSNDSVIRAIVIDKKIKDTLSSIIWNNQCTVADDGVVFNRLKSGENRIFTFHAIGKNGGLVTSDFEISRDQCHVFKVLGPSELSF